MSRRPLLVINSHEAWIYQLNALAVPFHIVDGMPGRYCASWDTNVRPVPRLAKLISQDEIVRDRRAYDCLIAHNISDLMALKDCPGPRLLVIHGTLEGRAANQSTAIPEGFAEMTKRYLDLMGAHVIAVSRLKARSWGFVHDVVPSFVDVSKYPAHDGSIPSGIRVANQVLDRREYLHWDFHEEAFGAVPMRLVGHNPGMAGVEPSKSWGDLKTLLSQHRFYVHTAHPELEDGYNMATTEAMACGLPVLGNRHPTSPVEHGVNGFVSDDPDELRACAMRLLEDRELAARMGQAARATALRLYSKRKFVEGMRRALTKAQKKWKAKKRKAGQSVGSKDLQGRV